MSSAHARVLNVETVQELPSWRRDRDQRDPREAERERRRALRALDVHRPLPAFRPDDTEEEKKPPACACIALLPLGLLCRGYFCCRPDDVVLPSVFFSNGLWFSLYLLYPPTPLPATQAPCAAHSFR